ncbi:class I SAM-dependent methyltransferase [Candidatus Woesearchaeota archaeon]|nr:class I SAM-dependent methyltransferase [Candidatus Woesearchaeota archaeon]
MRQSLEYIPCNLCGAKDTRVIYPARYDLERVPELAVKFKSSGDERLIDRVVQCRTCDLRYVSPRLNIDSIVKGYSEGSDETFISQARGRERTFARQLKIISKFTAPGRILDIGTAGGSLLAVAKPMGWKVEGIEPNKWLCNWGKEHYGITIKPGILEDYKFPNNSFDLITLMDVLEHTGDPKKVLEECNRILKPGGLIAINVPDSDSWLHRVMGRRWVFYLSVHLYYFNHKTMNAMLRHTGFKPLTSRPHFQLLEFGYLLFRLGAYSKLISNVGIKVARLLHIDRLLIPYWLGQTLFVARKVA